MLNAVFPPTHTERNPDPVQVTQMAKYLETVYVSGCSYLGYVLIVSQISGAYNILQDYPFNTVHSRTTCSWLGSSTTDSELFKTTMNNSLRPTVADADTDHGGLTAIMKLTKLFLEKGPAGIHVEKQARLALF
ncbi:isocitrate lyase [Lentinula raphanica]|nr:isocitrate lyase [Lentinula raphanica]